MEKYQEKNKLWGWAEGESIKIFLDEMYPYCHVSIGIVNDALAMT